MASKTNKRKDNGKAGENPGEKPVKKNGPGGKTPLSWWKENDKTRAVTGFLLTASGLYLFIALVSYFITWESDYDKISQVTFHEIISGESAFKNHTGSLGAALSHIMVYRGFGLAGLVFPFAFFLLGLRVAFKIRLLPLRKSFRICFYILIWLSVTMGFFFHQSGSVTNLLGGVFGNQLSLWLIHFLGKAGLALLLFTLLMTFTSINLNFPYSLIQRYRAVRAEQRIRAEAIRNEKAAAKSKDDKYNLQEYAVDESDPHEHPENNSPASGPADARPEFVDDEEDSDIEMELIRKEPAKTTPTRTPVIPDVEFTIETGNDNAGPQTDNNENDVVSPPGSINTPYDPTLDLPHYVFPGPELLETYSSENASVQMEELEANKKRIVETLNNYQIDIQKIKATIGPTVTLYEIVPAPGIRISKIKNLEDDIALSLAALGIRIIAPIPGKGTIGIEVPNQNPETVSIRSLLTSEKFINSRFELPIALGKTISNESYVADLTRMPHLLMAGATGQGKSVGLNAIITSLLYKKHPSQLKIVLVDPKKVELSLFSRIERHFLAKLPDGEEAIITDTRHVVRTLNSLCIEMDDRYALMKAAQVRTIKEYNAKFIARKLNPHEGHRHLPYIVLVVDEFADLIMTAGKEIEQPITRLAQMARAIGIHLIIATQRPSVNIITGTIKANFPARIAFRVSSKIDSRTILDTGGADQLIGRGDMLLSTGSDLLRLQCAFVDTPEIERLTDFIGSQRGYPEAFPLPEYFEEGQDAREDFDPKERDELFEDAARIIVAHQQGSTSLLQRKLKLGYNRAGRLIDQLEAAGIVGPFEGSKAREVKIGSEMALEQYLRDLKS
jgi:S-DNA-T family DNA segregation ATPase FtsK/SpoIIIE